ncbi:hypothetical protein DLAC_11650 [Tieghemostelium lacteum]|uniref:Uncharacterized protein n=1 Tax=Tieghemostelium lacteum TaxID=361077 RepID=A0A151ZEN0_TIELA|nr:hypothetical protein DLAC_11650 [Tieghemostelium lacteum]|eukprot:KYQ92387.1 hypothetical protein DLAC_11650 [Tieghemostelium lacteum]
MDDGYTQEQREIFKEQKQLLISNINYKLNVISKDIEKLNQNLEYLNHYNNAELLSNSVLGSNISGVIQNQS